MSGARASAVVVAAALLLGVFPSLAAQPLFNPTQDPVAGSRVFGEKGCARCHAINGIGSRVGPDLGRLPAPRTTYDLAAAMWNHLPMMAEQMRQLRIARPLLDVGETGNLLAFLFTANYFDPPGDLQQGRRLFAEKRCIVCHQVAGYGGVIGPNLDFLGRYGSPIFVAAAMWNHGPVMAEAMQARGIQRPRFDGSELTDLIAYLRSVAQAQPDDPLYVVPGRADEGRRLFAEKRCVECHAVGGQGGRLAPDLGQVTRQWSLMQLAAAMWNKAPAMTQTMKARGIAIPQLRPSDMADLVGYLYSLRYLAAPGDVQRGRELLTAKGCIGCHSVRGQGGKTASDLAAVTGLDSAPAVIAAMWNHSFATERPAVGAPPWPQLAATDLANLVAFFGAGARPR